MPDSTERPESFEDEIDHGVESYTTEELLELAQLNAQGIVLGTVEILAAGPTDLDTWQSKLAAMFLRGWDLERDWAPAEILDAVLTNLRSFGASVDSIELDGEKPSAHVSEFPDRDLVEMLQLTMRDGDQVFALAARIAANLGGTLTWTDDANGSYIIAVERSDT